MLQAIPGACSSVVRLHCPGPVPPAVYPGPCSGWSGRSLVIAVAGFSVRLEERRHLCACFCDLLYLFWPASAFPSLDVLGWRLGLYQRSLVTVFEILHLEGKEGEFQYVLSPFLFFPIPDVLLLESLGIPTDVCASLYTITLFHMFHRHSFVMPVA